MTGIGRARWSRRFRTVAHLLPLGAGLLLGGWSWVGVGHEPAGALQEGDGRPRVLSTRVDDSISPVIANHLVDVVDRAEDEGYDAVVVELDTPGGLDTSMRRIVQRFLAAEVPVVVYVSPDGARAASAGSFITATANVAAMAPGTAIGAATPVELGGGEVSDSDRKAINDAAAFAESIAEHRGRDVEFAVDTVRQGRSASAHEALELGAVDLVVRSLPELLEEIDGRTVEVAAGREVTLRTSDAVVDTVDLGLLRRIQQFLADPNLAFLFLSIGTLGIIYELADPGIGAAGALGAIFVILALFGLAVLPVNVVGLLLLGLAVALFVAELFAPGIGVAAAGGAGVLALSGVFLFRGTPGLAVSPLVIAPVVVVAAGAVVLAGRLVMRSRGAESTTTGSGLFVGRTVEVERLSPDGRGMAFVEGAWWTVRREGAVVEQGQARIVDVDGLTLVVEQGGPGSGTAEGSESESKGAS